MKESQSFHAQILLEKNAEVPSIELYMQSCECEKGTSQITVRHAFQRSTGRLQFADLLQMILQPNECRLLMQELEAK